MKNFQKYYNELNSEQADAVDTVDGPLLVLAGPGTGKTQLLSVRAASILEKKEIGPENILILTYTNSAAKAMKERLAKIIGSAGYDVEVATFHSFANSIIQGSEDAANYVGDKIQMSDIEQTRAIQHILDNTPGLSEVKPFRAPYTYLKDLIRKISELKKDGISPNDLRAYIEAEGSGYTSMEEKYQKRLSALADVYKRYEEVKTGKDKNIFDERGRYDFDDMILFASEALVKEKMLREEYRSQYKYVMVDEYQDTNGAQMELLFLLTDGKNPNLCCVGDDDQSIYRFQGASLTNFRILSKRFPGIKTIRLKENHRSTEDLIKVSRNIISRIPPGERMGEKALSAVKKYKQKEIVFTECTTETEELIYVADKIKELKKKIENDSDLSKDVRAHPYNNIAVLLRKRSDILKVIDMFLRSGIPYATDGKENISSEKRVRQLLDVLNLAHIDPGDCESSDLALYKVLTADYLELPLSDILKFLDYVNRKKKQPCDINLTFFSEFLKPDSIPDSGLKFCSLDKLDRAKKIITRLLADVRSRSVHTILMDFIKDANIFGYILREYENNQILRTRELRAMSSFVNMVKTSDLSNPAIQLDDFMMEMKTRFEHDIPVQGSLATLSQEGVRVYTAHGAKGLEFHSVIMPFCIHKKNWPVKASAEKIQLPSDLFKTKERISEKDQLKILALQDETRLFYVAATRARSNLIFTASPTENSIPSIYLTELDIPKECCKSSEADILEKSVDTTELKDPFIGTEKVLKDMIDNLSLNPTRINTYISCPRKFLYNDILRLPGAKKRSLVFGNCTHKALEETYKHYMDTKRFPAFKFFQEAFRRELKFQGVDRILERECLERMNSLKGWFDAASKSPVMPLGLERKLVVTVGENIIFTGKYDKVEWYDEAKGLVKIVDYKTGKPDNHLKDIERSCNLASNECDGYLRQLVCYKLLYEKDKKESKGRKVSCGTLAFTEETKTKGKGYEKGQYISKTVPITDAMVSEVDSLIQDVSGKIRSLRFDKLSERDESKCGMCDFNEMCWSL